MTIPKRIATAAVRPHHIEIDPGIGRAGCRVVLRVDARAVGADRGAGHDLDRAFIDPGDGEPRIVR